MRIPTLATGVRRARMIRSTAALLGALLVFGSLAPPVALAKHGGDTEGEGTSAPGSLPGLEIGIGHEPAGEETTLSEEPVGPEESEIEEEVPAPEVEEPEPEALEGARPPAPEAPPLPEPEVEVPVEEVPAPVAEPVAPPRTEAPSYGVEAPPPSYEPSPSEPPVAAGAVVQNETITGPTPRSPATARKSARSTSPSSPEVAAEPETAPGTPLSPEPSPSPPAVIPAAPVDRAGSLAGRKKHLVAAGECLWTIAAAYLPSGASNSEIAAEVHRLWRINTGRIGTGDPDALPIGVNLRMA